MTERVNLSIIVPAYNERDRLPITLRFFEQSLPSLTGSYEVIVVDDGSTDGTPEAIEALAMPMVRLICLATNSGKGVAVKRGVLASRGEYVLFSDADGSTPLTEAPKLLKQLHNGSKLVIGTRSDSSLVSVKQPLYRVLMGRLFNILMRIITGCDVSDSQCGFKAMHGDWARSIFSLMGVNGFAFDVELLYLAKLRGLQAVEIPVIWQDDARSKVQALYDPFIMFIDLLKIRMKHG